MKTFEEKWTAWVDGQLAGKELVEFEASLPDKAAAEAEKRGVQDLGALLKRELSAAVLTNEEFFSHQLRERIAREDASPAAREHDASSWWTIRRLFWTGAAAVALFLVFTVLAVRDQSPAPPSDSLTQVLQMRLDPTTNPNGTLTMFESQKDRVTVIWTEGLQTLPADYAAK